MVSECILKIAPEIWQGGSEQSVETADTTGLLQALCAKTQVRAQAARDSAPATYRSHHPNAESPEPGGMQQTWFLYFLQSGELKNK